MYADDLDGNTLRIDVYGTQTLDSVWDDWLNRYESLLGDGVTVSALEWIAGLRHLADTIASIHLATAMPIVDQGVYERVGAEDSLTDLWKKLYDSTSKLGLRVSSCEVCGRLYVRSHKAKRGHQACMNRQRVERSRAKKFDKLLKKGLGASEASKQAGISQSKAFEVLEKERA